jgi:pilus assembly protein Flp/PilA
VADFIKIGGTDNFYNPRSVMSISQVFWQLWHDTNGATAIEYGLIASLIAVAAVGALQLTGTNLSSTFQTVANNL